MPQDNLTKIVQPDPQLVERFSRIFNEGLRLTVRDVRPLPHRLFRQIGDTLNPGYTPGRAFAVGKACGVPLSYLEEPLHAAIAELRSWYPADLSLSVREASINEERTNAPVNGWQAALRDEADEFTLRRGIALAVEQRNALDQMIDAMRSQLAERRSLRSVSRLRHRPQQVAR